MPVTIDAVYRNGVFCPVTPPDLPEGTAVHVTVVPAPPPAAPPRDPAAVLARLQAIAAMPMEPGGDPTVTSYNVDEVLYGGPGGVR